MSAYQIAVPAEKIERLKQKLSLTDFPDELNGATWDHGAPLADIQRLARMWEHDFDWRAQEARLNALPNFHQPIPVEPFGDIDVHYLHQVSPSPDAIPLLFVHGWPGSYLEVLKLLPLLASSPQSVAFHVVAPSLPNFGWSARVARPGFGLRQYADVCDRLMQRLGYATYVTQGGDWGFYITRALGLLYPHRCVASHLNLIRASPPSFVRQPLLAVRHAVGSYSKGEKDGLERSRWFAENGAGYRVLQSTKPQTLGYALADSPVALLAWLWEKLHDWVDAYPWSDEEILTWVSVYYFSVAGPAASVRIYYESTHGSTDLTRDRMEQWIDTVKIGLCYAPRDLTVVPSTWGRTLGPVVYESRKSRGGHFAAHEIPDEIVKDLVSMFGKGGPCYGITKSKK